MILSISAIASAGITKPAAFMLFSSWLGLEAPAITQLISGCCRIHAMESTGRFVPSSSATLRSCSTLSRFSSVSRSLIWWSDCQVAREPAGSGWPLRYLPVSRPWRERGERGDADAELAAGAHDLMLDVTVV